MVDIRQQLKAQRSDLVEEVQAVGLQKVIAVHCQQILNNNQHVSSSHSFALRSLILPSLSKTHLDHTVLQGLLQDHNDLDQRLLVTREIRLQDKLIEEPQVYLFVVAVSLEEGLELGDQRVEVGHYRWQHIQDVNGDFDDLILEVPLQGSPVEVGYRPDALQDHGMLGLVGLPILFFNSLKHHREDGQALHQVQSMRLLFAIKHAHLRLYPLEQLAYQMQDPLG